MYVFDVPLTRYIPAFQEMHAFFDLVLVRRVNRVPRPKGVVAFVNCQVVCYRESRRGSADCECLLMTNRVSLEDRGLGSGRCF